MSIDADRNDRLEMVNTYFRKVDARDPTVLDLFTDDVQMFFPKFGLAHGKAALVKFEETMTSELESLEHDIDAFNYIVSGNFIVVEGTERGVTRNGVHWPDGVVSQGRFCSVFEFDGALIRRMHIYVDPDFTSEDQYRVRYLPRPEGGWLITGSRRIAPLSSGPAKRLRFCRSAHATRYATVI